MQDNSFKHKLIILSRANALLLIESVRIGVEIVGELPPRVYFLVLELIVVETHSL